MSQNGVLHTISEQPDVEGYVNANVRDKLRVILIYLRRGQDRFSSTQYPLRDYGAAEDHSRLLARRFQSAVDIAQQLIFRLHSVKDFVTSATVNIILEKIISDSSTLANGLPEPELDPLIGIIITCFWSLEDLLFGNAESLGRSAAIFAKSVATGDTSTSVPRTSNHEGGDYVQTTSLGDKTPYSVSTPWPPMAHKGRDNSHRFLPEECEFLPMRGFDNPSLVHYAPWQGHPTAKYSDLALVNEPDFDQTSLRALAVESAYIHHSSDLAMATPENHNPSLISDMHISPGPARPMASCEVLLNETENFNKGNTQMLPRLADPSASALHRIPIPTSARRQRKSCEQQAASILRNVMKLANETPENTPSLNYKDSLTRIREEVDLLIGIAESSPNLSSVSLMETRGPDCLLKSGRTGELQKPRYSRVTEDDTTLPIEYSEGCSTQDNSKPSVSVKVFPRSKSDQSKNEEDSSWKGGTENVLNKSDYVTTETVRKPQRELKSYDKKENDLPYPTFSKSHSRERNGSLANFPEQWIDHSHKRSIPIASDYSPPLPAYEGSEFKFEPVSEAHQSKKEQGTTGVHARRHGQQKTKFKDPSGWSETVPQGRQDSSIYQEWQIDPTAFEGLIPSLSLGDLVKMTISPEFRVRRREENDRKTKKMFRELRKMVPRLPMPPLDLAEREEESSAESEAASRVEREDAPEEWMAEFVDDFSPREPSNPRDPRQRHSR